MNDDGELLQRYAGRRDQAAFAELVQRHVNLVYSAALRQVNGDAHLAEDAAQMVFADLARKAAALASHRVLAGWLFTSTRFAAAKLVRSEQRRRTREQEAHMMKELTSDPGGAVDWARVRPVLDAALADLNHTDREALLLRFFEGCGFAEVGERLQLSENTARMRVERALEKLHARLARRGVTSSGAALAVALSSQGVMAAPAGLAATISGAVLATTAGAVGGGLVAGVNFMTMGKFSLGVFGGLLAGGLGGVALHEARTAQLQEELAQLQQTTAPVAATGVARRDRSGEGEAGRSRPADAELDRLAAEAAALKRETSRSIPVSAQLTEGGSKPARVYDYAEVDQPPQVAYRKPPVYPFDLRKDGIEGEALVQFVVGGDGAVHDVSVVRASHVAFGEAAAEAVQEWRFDAAAKDGVPVNVKMQQSISFSMGKDQPPPKDWF